MISPKKEKEFYAKDRKAWRKWLEKNHQKEKFVWLIIYKQSSAKKSVTYVEAVEEGLCFGWIDSKPNKRDEESHFQYFAIRNPKSKWAKTNKIRVEKLIAENKMWPAGLEMIEIAKKSGTWDALNEIDNEIMPDDLLKQFKKNKKAYNNFLTFPSSSRKIILLWVMEAKREETRLKRIKETVALAAKNIRANHYVR